MGATLFVTGEPGELLIDLFGRRILKEDSVIDLLKIKGDYHHERAKRTGEREDTKQAVDAFTALVALNPDNAMFRRRLGLAQLNYDNEAAIATASQAILLDPSYAFNYRVRAFALKNMGRLEEAIEDFSNALELRETPDAHVGLGQIYEMQGNHAVAQQKFQDALNVDPDNFDAHLCLGLTYIEDVNPKLALHHARRALEKQPSDEAHALLGLSKLLDGDVRGAMSSLESYCSSKDNEGHTFLDSALGAAYKELGDEYAAGSHFFRAIQKSPKSANYWGNWGVTLIDSGHHHSGYICLEKTKLLDSSLSTTHTNLAYYFLAIGKPADALDSIGEIEKMGAELSYFALVTEGRALQTLGKDHQAIASYSEALKKIEKEQSQVTQLRPSAFLSAINAEERLGELGVTTGDNYRARAIEAKVLAADDTRLQKIAL